MATRFLAPERLGKLVGLFPPAKIFSANAEAHLLKNFE